MSTIKTKELTQHAIYEASRKNVEVTIEKDVHTLSVTIHARTGTHKSSHTFAAFEIMTSSLDAEELFAEQIKIMVEKLTANPESRINELESELRTYKDAVKQLAFELEMSATKQTAIRADKIRKFALQQAARYVMDFGIPKTGADLVRLCKEIEELKTTKDQAIADVLKVMDEGFKK